MTNHSISVSMSMVYQNTDMLQKSSSTNYNDQPIK